MELSKNKLEVINFMDEMAGSRSQWVKKNQYYYDDLAGFLKYNILEKSSILEIGCGNGFLLDAIKPGRGVGIDLSGKMIFHAKESYPNLVFYKMDAEDINLAEDFDYVVMSDALGYMEDIQKVFRGLKGVVSNNSRIIITYHSFFWLPFLRLAESLGLKMPQKKLNWLNGNDILNLLELEGFEAVKTGRRFLLPVKISVISAFINHYIANLPVVNWFCLTGYIIAKTAYGEKETGLKSVSVVVPARNEEGNIENIVKRLPLMGNNTEIIFVEGHSRDGTLAEIKRVREKYKTDRDIKYFIQDGRGKGDAVRKGFAAATGDILMILDADMTVPPEDLPKFFEAIATGRGEFINGTRLVYPLEDEAMRFLNIGGNKFFSWMFSWLLGQRLKDTLCGTKVISRQNYLNLIKNRKFFGEFDPFGDFDLLFGAAKLNLKIVEIPIRYQAREYGETQISRFTHGWLLLKMVFFAMNKIKFL